MIEEQSTYLTFNIGNYLMAVKTDKVIKVLSVPNLTQIPDNNPKVLGIVNYLGEIITITDLSSLLGFDKQVTGIETVIHSVMFDGKKYGIGFMVDNIKKVVLLKETEIQPVTEAGLPFDPLFVHGSIKTTYGRAFILNFQGIVDIIFFNKML